VIFPVLHGPFGEERSRFRRRHDFRAYESAAGT
jgi:hypothetical protein